MLQYIVRNKDQLREAYDLNSVEIIVKGSFVEKIAKIIWGKDRIYYSDKRLLPLIMNGSNSSRVSTYESSLTSNIHCDYVLCIKSMIYKMKVLYNILKVYKITYYNGDTMKFIMKRNKS
ncbi:hypothetical protein CM240_1992 [Clostridium bornimense]|uniref:Uncharacterized protein n=1 Tax=Clostridium bornimense TaxID=1216932 RepID=W6SHI4_9CLOT|nr:hypothetical protein [Clostridium bornimense]CDM69150.1 hypothetical protein CM240_1992 [Clostridium bornimense]